MQLSTTGKPKHTHDHYATLWTYNLCSPSHFVRLRGAAAYADVCWSAYVSIRQHMLTSIRQHTSDMGIQESPFLDPAGRLRILFSKTKKPCSQKALVVIPWAKEVIPLADCRGHSDPLYLPPPSPLSTSSFYSTRYHALRGTPTHPRARTPVLWDLASWPHTHLYSSHISHTR